MRQNLIEEGAAHVKEDTLLIADVSDVSKKYAKKEHLAEVRDGSEEKITKGYWTVRVMGAEVERVKTIALYQPLYSQNAPDFISENEEVVRAVGCVKGFGHQPLMLLTNVEVKPSRKSLLFPVESYLRRWQIEETIRFAPGRGQANLRNRRHSPP